MRKSWSLALVLMAGMAGAAAKADAIVTGDLNLRSQPSAGASRLAVLPQGAQVAVLGCVQQGWCDVSMGGLRGWASARYLRQIAPTVVYLRPNAGYVTQRMVLVPANGWNAAGYQVVTPGWGQAWGGGWYVQR